MYARPQFDDGTATTLGVSGKLWRDALVMYDRRTRSLWSQIDGRAKAGPMSGETLEKIPSQMTTWANWKARHPKTLVLLKPPLEESPYAKYHDEATWVGLPWTRVSDDDRLPKKALVLGIELSGRAVAVRLDGSPGGSHGRGLVQETLGETSLLVVWPEDPRSALAYEREDSGTTLHFRWQAGDTSTWLVDEATGSRWNWQTGEAVSGSLSGKRLKPIAASPVYWTTWVSFYPQTEVW